MECGKHLKAEKQLKKSEQGKLNQSCTPLIVNGDSGVPIDLKRTRDLSIEDVKRSDRFKFLTDEEAIAMIETIKGYTNIIYQLQVGLRKVA